MYENYIKRVLDILCSFCALAILSPIFLSLTILGAVFMGGNPFFTQLRPGKNGKLFKLVKFCSMTNERDENGNLLPDAKRLTKYGKFLRRTSLDELPELWNILKGELSIVGPRPLLPEYLLYYNEIEARRHNVRPGLTGWAQVNGRNDLEWEKRFQHDVYYVDNISFFLDVKVILYTIVAVFKHSGIHENTNLQEGNFAEIRKSQMENEIYKNKG